MQDVLIFILKNIVTLPDDVQVKEEIEDDVTNYSVTVNPADIGRVIGKEGKVVKAIRTIMRVVAIQKGARVRVSIISEQADVPTLVQDESPDQDESIAIEV